MAIGGISIGENVLPEDYLELSNGILVKNLKELAGALADMDKDEFNLHVTKSRNDFAEWILEAYDDEKLTKKLLKTNDKDKTIKILNDIANEAESKKINKIEMPKNKKNVLKKLGEVSYEM